MSTSLRNQSSAPFIMVSFSKVDEESVDRLLATLRKHEIDFFEFRRDIQPGENMLEAVRDAIRKCTHVVMYASPASVDSQWVWLETGMGFALQKAMIFYLQHPSIKLPVPFSYLRHIVNEEEFERFAERLREQGQ